MADYLKQANLDPWLGGHIQNLVVSFSKYLFLIFCISFVCFYLLSLIPGDPTDLMATAEGQMSLQDIQRIRDFYGLDQPILSRYWNWVGRMVRGDFGLSRVYKVQASEILFPRLLNTALLAFCALFLSVILGVLLGTLAALFRGRSLDRWILSISICAMSLPTFWLGILFIMGFSVHLRWLPAGGTGAGFGDLSGVDILVERIRHLILPVLTLSATQIGVFVRYTRELFIETLGADYVRTAYSKGLPTSRVLTKHCFKNVLIPLITITGLHLSHIFSGSVIVETIFAYNGIGKLIYDSILGSDFNIAMLALLINIISVLMMGFVFDSIYHWIDPRIKRL